jgi:uncharacterized repeat protein (TIGR01451 family)
MTSSNTNKATSRFGWMRILLSALLFVALTAGAAAAQSPPAQINFVSISGNWHDAVDNMPGSQLGDPVITNGNPTSSISWGQTMGTPQSGYDFTAVLPPSTTFPGPSFSFGTFTHRNFEVNSPSLTSVQLDIVLVLSVNGVQTAPLTFTYTFNHEETPNNVNPCPYPTPPGEGCTDRVTIVSSAQPTTFNIGGVDYTFALNFNVNGSPVTEFITREGGTINSSGLDGNFVLPPAPLTVVKTGPATMNLGQLGDFALDVHNTGTGTAWNTTLRDLLPDGATGGMCDLTPQIVNAQVFQSNGVTPVPGKGPLSLNVDYTLSYSAAPSCRLDITILTDAGSIGPNERLIVRYRTQLDSDTQSSVALTNIAGAVQWFNGPTGNPSRQTSTGALTNGTPGVLDHEDAHTVTASLSGYFFDKTVANLTSGTNPATTATPGDTLRYTLRVRTTNQALANFRILDDLEALNANSLFVPGTLALVAYPAGADISGTNSNGGTKGTGLIDIRNLNLPVDSQAVIQFDIRLRPTIANGAIAANQSTGLLANGTTFAVSDDPNVNGTADPAVSGDEDPTRVTIASGPVFRLQKISTDLTGDPNVLLAGETLRYTITVKNVGNSDAANVVLRDAVPANTTYIAGSTIMNGAAVADVGTLSPLVNGMPINSPSDPTPGSMPADPSSNTSNVSTITFDVVVNSNIPDGTIISNQGFVSAPGNGIVDQPSDDPNTPAVNDPTRNVAGNHALLYAEKRVVLFGDAGSPGIVDPGDVLRYTITVQNSAGIAATAVVLRDAVPANTSYVANSTLLNGQPVGQPDSGVSPLASGINISSSDLTPPLPGPGAGTISPGATSVLQFDLRVNAGTPVGTLIRNQAVVSSTGLANLLTDGDGNPSTGPEPTVMVVGAGQQLSISNQVTVVGGGPAIPGSLLEYTVNVVNIAAVPAFNVVITDDLNGSQPGQLAFVNGSGSMNGFASGFTFSGSTITANYAAVNGPLAPGSGVVLRFRATLNPNLALGTVVINTGIVTWNTPTQTAVGNVSLVVGSAPGAAILSGFVWHDSNLDDVRNASERTLAGWTVELYRDNQLWQSALTGTNGAYRVAGVDPNDLNGVQYELRFHAPGSGTTTALLGRTVSPFTNGLQRITNIVAGSGADLQDLNLPIHPNGVVYNSVVRTPIAGAALTMLAAPGASPLPVSCFDDAAQQGQVTPTDGYYKFDINFSDPACPNGGDYIIGVTPPAGSTFVSGYSQIIPPSVTASGAAFSLPNCPGTVDDAIPSTTLFCESQASEFSPGAAVPPRTAGTIYYVLLRLGNNQMPGSSQIFNNHIPLDPQVNGSVAITKTTPLLNVSRGLQVPYVITVRNSSGQLLTDVSIVDRLPAGFTYVKGSALLDGSPAEPTIAGQSLNWNGLSLAGTEVHTVKLLLLVGAGVSEGEYVNHAQAMNVVTGIAMSSEATATVRLVPDPTLDCTDVTGKVFNDANRNGRQDAGEDGLAGVRVVTVGGLHATTDKYGRYHITCATTPDENRGSNFVLKLDDRTLPSGFRMSTNQVQIERATRGKDLRVNFAGFDFPGGWNRSLRCSVRNRNHSNPPPVAATSGPPPCGTAQSAGGAAPVVCRRHGRCSGCRTTNGSNQAATDRILGYVELQLFARHRD